MLPPGRGTLELHIRHPVAGGVGSWSVSTRTAPGPALTAILDPPDTQCMGDLADILSDWEDAVLPDDQRAWDFLVDFNVQLSKVLSHKNVEADAQTTRRAKAILDTVYGVHDACA